MISALIKGTLDTDSETNIFSSSYD